ncbi:hypothetical protein Q8F57_039760 [Paraburkholderia terrae]|uniref:hypothetical protein n=1 Tax=Paraburkholderia terrae TaxID=311230 RepID=UPI00296B2811|nr:hypothetical protein [Paraburkholderia terrae]MDW3656986.1 hypothetical protein [Paraburkholderia terrae]
MRVIVIKQASDLQTLATRLIGKRADGSALERVKALNPHVDFERIEPGTVLLLPDMPGIKAGDKDTRFIAGDAFDSFVKDSASGLEAAAKRVAAAADSLATERAAVSGVTRLAAMKRLIDGDPVLQRQLSDAGAAWNREQKEVKDAAAQIGTMQKVVSEELAALRRLLE